MVLLLSLHHKAFSTPRSSEYWCEQPTLPGDIAPDSKSLRRHSYRPFQDWKHHSQAAPRRHSHSFWATTSSLSPSPQVGTSPITPETKQSACASSFLLFMCAWFWFQWLSSVTDTTPSPSLPGAWAGPGWQGQARSLGDSKQGSQRTSHNPCSAQTGPVSWVARARAQEPSATGTQSLTAFIPGQGPCPIPLAVVLQTRPRNLRWLDRNTGQSRPGDGAFVVEHVRPSSDRTMGPENLKTKLQKTKD